MVDAPPVTAAVVATRLRESVSQELLRLDKQYNDKIVIIIVACVVDDAIIVMPAANCSTDVSIATMRVAAQHMLTTPHMEIHREPDDMKGA